MKFYKKIVQEFISLTSPEQEDYADIAETLLNIIHSTEELFVRKYGADEEFEKNKKKVLELEEKIFNPKSSQTVLRLKIIYTVTGVVKRSWQRTHQEL